MPERRNQRKAWVKTEADQDWELRVVPPEHSKENVQGMSGLKK